MMLNAPLAGTSPQHHSPGPSVRGSGDTGRAAASEDGLTPRDLARQSTSRRALALAEAAPALPAVMIRDCIQTPGTLDLPLQTQGPGERGGGKQAEPGPGWGSLPQPWPPAGTPAVLPPAGICPGEAGQGSGQQDRMWERTDTRTHTHTQSLGHDLGPATRPANPPPSPGWRQREDLPTSSYRPSCHSPTPKTPGCWPTRKQRVPWQISYGSGAAPTSYKEAGNCGQEMGQLSAPEWAPGVCSAGRGCPAPKLSQSG